MLTLLGLLGALFAGALAETAITLTNGNSDSDQDDPDAADGGDDAAGDPNVGTIGDMLNDTNDLSDGVVCNDIPDEEDASVQLHGDMDDNLMSGGGNADVMTGGAGDDQLERGGRQHLIDEPGADARQDDARGPGALLRQVGLLPWR